ncbi:hypothetical protein [Kurthia gibsonii]|uniref:hypothetical protein n=1 Tax=Kurthia gibsonii TaxID=33946 RepID=UPI0011441ED9|nr:hypothetical protein [Kurthia gibsonii]GED20996.1 hypothetical protein KGI01_27370 [Kurthia gibsonii]
MKWIMKIFVMGLLVMTMSLLASINSASASTPSNYEVQNEGNQQVYVKVPAISKVVIYAKDGRIVSQGTVEANQMLNLSSGTVAIISYVKQVKAEPTVEPISKKDVKIKKTKEKAFSKVTLKKNEQAVITTKTAAHANQLLLEDRTKFATYHSVVYREDGSIYEQRANEKITAILGDVVRMASGGSAVVENVGKSPLSVYGASRIYTVKKTKEKAFSKVTLKKNERAAITSKTVQGMNNLLLEDPTQLAIYHTVTYRAEQTVYEQRAHAQIRDILGSTIRMTPGGNAVVENVGKSPLSVYGASRIYTVKKTKTPPFRTIRIQPNERATIHTTEPLGNTGFGAILVDDQVAEGFYHYSSYWKKGTLLYEQRFNKSTKQFILNNIRYRDEGQIVVENIGKTPIILYASERYTTYAIMPITEKE